MIARRQQVIVLTYSHLFCIKALLCNNRALLINNRDLLKNNPGLLAVREKALLVIDYSCWSHINLMLNSY